MKLGLITSILDGLSFEETVDYCSSIGLECMEVACWPKGGAERRYSGVSHIDCDNLTSQKAEYINEYCRSRNIEISALAYYPNVLDSDLNKREQSIAHLMNVINAASMLNVNMVTTFIGRQQEKNVDDNLKVVEEIWKPIIQFAEEKKVKIAIENCPMLFTNNEWPGGQNIMTSPANWRKVFNILNSDYIGINYDPSHFIWQQIDYIKPIYEFKDKIFHVHFKDIKVFEDKLKDVGVMATPLQYMTPKIPGLGDVDWSAYVSALTDIGYDGPACLEIEDKAFEGSMEMIKKSIRISSRYMKNFI
ncbi:MAG: sugar phosphate isomerase/epimerase [Lachnospiraceae bacterium]|nr:sugar phosphate isomerase/epimerase [Lachnospiraceae bacterium]